MMKKLQEFLKNPLYKNSLFITLGRFIDVAIGFIFWMVAAKVYSVEDVGIATALISSLNIIIVFSRFGFDFSLIRFIRINDKKKVFNTSFTITTVASFTIGIIYILGINFFSYNLFFIQRLSYAMIFLLFVVMSSIASITGVAFTAIRKADYYFFQNILLAIRVPLLIPLVFLGKFGIFGSVGLAYVFSALFAILYVKNIVGLNLEIDSQFIKESFSFSSGNYVSNVFLWVPTLIMPIMVLSLLGEAAAAKFFVAFAVGNLVLIIPDALCTSLFVEGSHGEDLKKNVIKAGFTIYSFLIPAVIFIYFFGGYILAFIGKDYVESLKLLRFLTLSSFLVTVFSLFISIQNIRMNVESIIKLNLLRFLLLSVLSYFLILKFGVVGIGYAWIITYGILDLVIAILIKKVRWI